MIKNLNLPLYPLLFVLLITLSMQSLMGATLAQGFDDSEVMHIDHPDWFIESPFLDLAEDLNKAAANGKKGLMILFTTEGCSYCDLFIRLSLSNPEIAAVVQKNFDSIGLEIFDDVEMTDPEGTITSVKQFAKKEGVEFSPTLLFYGENGHRLLRLVGYQSPQRFKNIMAYLSDGHFQDESLTDYLKKVLINQAGNTLPAVDLGKAALRKDPLFEQPPYALDRSHFAAHQPLLVIFEKPSCPECDQFHSEVLALQDVRETLSNFEIVRLHAEDFNTPVLTPDGQRITPALWYAQTSLSRVPALLFFDKRGHEVLKTDALVLHQRMMNSLNYVLEEAYKKDWTYQQFARSKAIERSQ